MDDPNKDAYGGPSDRRAPLDRVAICVMGRDTSPDYLMEKARVTQRSTAQREEKLGNGSDEIPVGRRPAMVPTRAPSIISQRAH